MNENTRPLTVGEKVVGLTFNPGNNPDVDACKREFAIVIDRMQDLFSQTNQRPEVKRMAEIAIQHAQTAQMWAVKAITWRS
jgi:hypothetical protein